MNSSDNAAHSNTKRANPSSGTPNTLWSLVVIPAREGSEQHLGQLFQMYEKPICNLIRQFRKSLSEDDIRDLYQQFVLVCIRREFLESVDKTKGRFRDYLRTCLKRFLIDDARRRREPVEKADLVIDVGGGEEGALQMGAEDSVDWLTQLDEEWALTTEQMALNTVFKSPARATLAKNIQDVIRNRLMASQDDEATLEADALALGMPSVRYTNRYSEAKKAYRAAIRTELEKQVDARDLDEEKRHLIKVLTGIRRRKAEALD